MESKLFPRGSSQKSVVVLTFDVVLLARAELQVMLLLAHLVAQTRIHLRAVGAEVSVRSADEAASTKCDDSSLVRV